MIELKVKLSRTLQRADLGLAFLGDGERRKRKKTRCMSNSDGDGCVVAHAVDAQHLYEK